MRKKQPRDTNCRVCGSGPFTARGEKAHLTRTNCKHWASMVKEHQEADLVNHPPHYTTGKYEVIDVLEDWFPTDPLSWQVGKYLARAPHKGNPLQDLEKAKWYLERKIAQLKSQEASPNVQQESP